MEPADSTDSTDSIDPYALRRIPSLDGLEADELAALAKHLRSSRFVEGSKICLEGKEADRCYFLVSGVVQVSKSLEDERFIPLAVLREGALFGQSGLVENQARTAQVTAMGDVDVFMLERATLDWALNRREPWAVALQQAVAFTLVRQLRSAMERFEALASAAPEARLLLVEGEAAQEKQKPVYMNLSDSFAALPSVSSPRRPTPAPPSHPDAPAPAPPPRERSDETERLYELLQVTESSGATDDKDND